MFKCFRKIYGDPAHAKKDNSYTQKKRFLIPLNTLHKHYAQERNMFITGNKANYCVYFPPRNDKCRKLNWRK